MSVPTAPPVVLRDAAFDWVKFDAELARDGSVDPVDKALYAALASFVDQANREADDDPNGEDVPTRKRLAACIGRSVDTVDRATKRLEACGLLEVERRRDPANPKRNVPSVYRLLDGERWDERAAERAVRRKTERERHKREKDTQEGGRTGAARVAALVRPGWPHQCGGTSSSQERDKNSSPPSPPQSVAEAEPPRSDLAGREDEAPPETPETPGPSGAPDTSGDAETLLDDAVRCWPSGHRAPSPRDRQRLSQRVAAELADGGEPEVILDELTRDLATADKALNVVMARTSTPGWGRSADPRPPADAYVITGPRPPWCGICTEHIRHLGALAPDGTERVIRCPQCHPEATHTHLPTTPAPSRPGMSTRARAITATTREQLRELRRN